MASRGRKLLLVAFGLVLPVVLVALLEGVLALFGVAEEERFRDPFVGFAPGSRLFEERTVAGQRRYVTRPSKLAFFNEQSFPVEKEAGTYRIFSLGGSTTFGRPYDDRASFSHGLRVFLPAADPSRKWEVINAGGVSYASYRVVLLMQELAEYEPDLFIVYTGHNEFLEERSYGDILEQPEWLRGLREELSGLRTAALVRRLLPEPGAGEAAQERVQLAGEVEARLDGWTGLDAYQRDDELARGVTEHFAFNLRRMARIAEGAGARILFVAPASNLKDFSPFKSQSGAEAGAEEIARARRLRERAVSALGEGDGAAAHAAAQEAVTRDPLHAEGWFLLGQAQLLLGDLAAAREAFVKAKDLDVAPLRALEALVQEVRRSAAEASVPLVDFPEVLKTVCRERHGHEILGNELFQDHVHPTVEAHGILAQVLLQEMVEEGIVNPVAGWNEARRGEIFRRELATLDPVYSAQRELNLGKVLGWAGKLAEAEGPLRRAAQVLTEEPDVFLNLGILLSRTGRPEEAIPLLERASRLEAGSASVELNLGVAYGRVGELERGVEALREASRKNPNLAEAQFNLGGLLRRQGKLEEAQEALGKALELRPEAPETAAALASLLAEKGQGEEGRRLLEEHLREFPWAPGHLVLAELLAEAGEPRKALEETEAALHLDPASAEAFYRQGLILASLGRSGEAEAAYRKALELAPDYGPAANNLALRRAAAGDLQGASELLVRAIESNPGYADAYFNLGVVYDQAGLPRDAVRAIEKALELDPENARYRQALGMLQQALEVSG